MGKQRIYFIFFPFSLNLIHIYCIFCLKLLHIYFLYEVLLFMKHQYCHCFKMSIYMMVYIYLNTNSMLGFNSLQSRRHCG